jgi:hypothetical protein
MRTGFLGREEKTMNQKYYDVSHREHMRVIANSRVAGASLQRPQVLDDHT